MRKLSLVLGCISLLLIRIVLGTEQSLSEGTRVRIVIPTIDFPEYTETATIIKRGKWEVRGDGYTSIMPGEVVEAEGVIDKQGRIISEQLDKRKESRISLIDRLLIGISYVRKWAVTRFQTQLPEPMAALAAGILLGVKARMPRDFYDALVATGTVHIVAASGFNVMIVAQLLMAIFEKLVRRATAIGMGIGGIVFYVLLSGGSASVVRAGVMGSLTLMARYLGRQAEAKWLLWVTAFTMIMVEPAMITNIGFELSVAATFGILYGGSWLERLKEKFLRGTRWKLEWVDEYMIPTLAATLATAPVIVWHFGRISIMGVGVNLLILPVVPLIMMLAALALILPGVNYLLYVPLWWVVTVIGLLGA